MQRGFFSRRGQSLFEWLLLIALVSIVAIAVLNTVGRKGQADFQAAQAEAPAPTTSAGSSK